MNFTLRAPVSIKIEPPPNKIDNILWKGEVVNPLAKDKLTKLIKNFNNYIKKLKINKYIVPIGDGFLICWKK